MKVLNISYRQYQYRRSKIAAIEQLTERPLIVYATACTVPPKPGLVGDLLMLDISDKIGFKTVTDNVSGPNLDVLVHSPGGYAEVVESIVTQLRGKYNSIRFLVPSYAKSAATMLVMSGNEILMDTDAELGPIDPQLRTQTGSSPAEAILEQFQKAQIELQQDPTKLPSWMPILAQLGPSLLVDCTHAIDLAKNLVEDWTKKYMLNGDPQAGAKSTAIANYLSSHATFRSHARPIKIPDLVPLGVKVIDLCNNPVLHAAMDELYCCLDILFANSGVYKLFENSHGDALIRQTAMFQTQLIQAMPLPAAPRPGPAPAPMPPAGIPRQAPPSPRQRSGRRTESQPGETEHSKLNIPNFGAHLLALVALADFGCLITLPAGKLAEYPEDRVAIRISLVRT